VITSLTLTAGGAQPWFTGNAPATCPVDLNDPRVNIGLIPGTETGPGTNLQLLSNSIEEVTKRGWESWAWHWQASMSATARIFVFSTANRLLTEDDIRHRPDPPIETGISVNRPLPLTLATGKVQPDFTLLPNVRPNWISLINGQPAVPGVTAPWKARGFLTGLFPIASNLVTGQQFGAVMVLEGIFSVNLMTPYLVRSDGGYYCFISLSLSLSVIAAETAEMVGDEVVYVPLGPDWIFQDFDATSQELLSSSATSMQLPPPNELPVAGNVSVQDSFYTPADVWGVVPMYAPAGLTILGADLRCMQHYN
jgi:hypothetical protein